MTTTDTVSPLRDIANMLDGYASNYAAMARQNKQDPRVNMTCVEVDIRQNMKGFVLERIAAAERAALAAPVAAIQPAGVPPTVAIFSNGSVFGTVSDEQIEVMLEEALIRVRKRSGLAASAPAQPEVTSEALFNGFDISKLPSILISCVAKLWPGSNGLFWEKALESMPDRIEHLLAAPVPAAPADKLQAYLDASQEIAEPPYLPLLAGIDPYTVQVADAPADKGELPNPAEHFVFAGLDWHRATPDYFAQANGAKLALYTAEQVQACVLADRARQAAIAQPSGAVPASRALHNSTVADDEPKVDSRCLYFWRAGWNACRDVLTAVPQPPASTEADDERCCNCGLHCQVGNCVYGTEGGGAPQPPSTGSIADDAEFIQLLGRNDVIYETDIEIICAYIDTRTAALIDAASKERGGDALANLYHAIQDILPAGSGARFAETGKWLGDSAYALRGIAPTMQYRADDMAVVYAAMDEAVAAIATTKAAK